MIRNLLAPWRAGAWALPFAVLPAAGTAAPRGGTLDIAITNVRDGQGSLNVQLCSEASFLKTCPLAKVVKARAGTVLVRFDGLPPGRYAVQAYHDRNGNGEADRNLVSLPTEDIGFSNDALKGFSPPRFAVAAIEHGTAPQRITFRMRSIP